MAETAVLTLSDFLLARIADDEAEAHEMAGNWPHDGGWSPRHVDRVLNECDLKRSFVHLADCHDDWRYGIHSEAITTVLRAVALLYADHPEYREDWRQ